MVTEVQGSEKKGDQMTAQPCRLSGDREPAWACTGSKYLRPGTGSRAKMAMQNLESATKGDERTKMGF